MKAKFMSEHVISKLRVLYNDINYINSNLCFCKSDGLWYKYDILHNYLDRQIGFRQIDKIDQRGMAVATGDMGTVVYSVDGLIINAITNPLKFIKIVRDVLHLELMGEHLNGIVDLYSDKVIVPFKYTHIRFYKDSDYIVLCDDAEVLSDYAGRILTSKLYDTIRPLKDGSCIARLGNDMYRIDINTRVEEYKIGLWSKVGKYRGHECCVLNTN